MPPMWIVLALLPILGGAERFNCKGRILGAYYADAKSGCKAFHVCVRVAGGGIRDFRFFCPPGTLFHQEAQTCTDWGDDDPLACPADIYDGQFDLYKIGSGFDTKKISAAGNRDDETEFGLQRAETGDRRLSQGQSSVAPSGASDLRAAHSSDFFSGQRERGRDDSVAVPLSTSPSQSRQSFRRSTTPRSYTQPTTQYTTTPPPPPQPSSPAQYDVTKRKLVRKRPIYVSTPAPQSTVPQNTQSTYSFSEQTQQPYQQYHQQPQQQQYQRQPQQQPYQRQSQKQQYEQSQQQQQQNQDKPLQRPQNEQYFLQKPQQKQQQQLQLQPQQQSQQQLQQQPQQQPQQKLQQQPQQQPQPRPQQQLQQQPQQQLRQQHNYQQKPQQFNQQQQDQQQQKLQQNNQQNIFQQNPQQYDQEQPSQQQQYFKQKPVKQSQEKYQQQQPHKQQPEPEPELRNNNFQNNNRRIVPQNRPSTLTSTTPTLPPQFNDYKDEYVEVSRVNPKQNKHHISPSPAPFSQTTRGPFTKKDNLVELYNYDAQSTPGLNGFTKNSPSTKVQTSFSVTESPYELKDFLKARNVNSNTDNIRNNAKTTITDYNTGATRTTSTPTFKNYNSVTYESDKTNFVPFSKQNSFNNPNTTPVSTTVFTKSQSNPPSNLNAIAYNTNLGFNTHNFDQVVEDDGQYHLPQGEDDGQYKPELYDRELLSGAHSLNIAASGNRLPDDQKSRGKSQTFKSPQPAVPRPFRPAPTPTSAPTQTTLATEPTYTTTVRPQTRNFDFYQTYTTTSRPSESPVSVPQNFAPTNNAVTRTTLVPKIVNTRPESRPPPPPTLPSVRASRPTLPSSTVPPYFANPASKKEDTSYDYAYYDSDPGFAEYDHIEEFGRTKVKA